MNFLAVGLGVVGILAVASIYLQLEASLSDDSIRDTQMRLESTKNKIDDLESRIANIEAGFVHDLDEKLLEIDQKLDKIIDLDDRVGNIEAGFVHNLDEKLLEIDQKLAELEAKLTGSQ